MTAEGNWMLLQNTLLVCGCVPSDSHLPSFTMFTNASNPVSRLLRGKYFRCFCCHNLRQCFIWLEVSQALLTEAVLTCCSCIRFNDGGVPSCCFTQNIHCEKSLLELIYSLSAQQIKRQEKHHSLFTGAHCCFRQPTLDFPLALMVYSLFY